MLWDWDICSHLGTSTSSLEECKAKCLEKATCTGFNFGPGGKDNCELYQCPASVLEPTRNHGKGWMAYSRITSPQSTQPPTGISPIY